MKTFFFLLVIGAVLALGGAFFEMWTIPRLERMPTISDYATRSRDIQERAERELGLGPGDQPKGGPFAPAAPSTRQRQFNDARSQLGR